MGIRQLRTQRHHAGIALGVRRRWMRQGLSRQSRKISATLVRGKALLWRRLYALRYRFLLWKARRGTIVAIMALALVVALSALSIPMLQDRLAPNFATDARLNALRALFLTLGGSLVGAATIVTSLVLFAMQVNVERMPHGLFRRLSGDRRLLGAFALTFVLAVTVAAISLVPDATYIGSAIFAAGWGTILILTLFLYGYQRALLLISPIRQLGLVVADARRELRAWPRRAARLAPLAALPKDGHEYGQALQMDYQRLAFLQLHPGWTDAARQAVHYAVSFARRYAEQGDHEVSAAALNAIIAINAAYVQAKGITFFASNPMLDNPLVTDGFIQRHA